MLVEVKKRKIKYIGYKYVYKLNDLIDYCYYDDFYNFY